MKSLVFPRIFLHCVALGFIVSGLLLSGRSEVRIPSGVPSRSKLCIACSDLFYKSERAHTAAPPFHPANALPVCGVRRRGPWNVGIFLLVPLRFAVKVFCGEFGVLHIVESISLAKTEK